MATTDGLSSGLWLDSYMLCVLQAQVLGIQSEETVSAASELLYRWLSYIILM